MTKEIWLNLPVKDVLKSRAFYEQIGFTFNPNDNPYDSTMQCMFVGQKNFVVMLFPEETLQKFSRIDLNDRSTTSQFLISIDAESREEIDHLTAKAKAAGATIFAEPEEIQGWMYGSGFTDLDGHRWNTLYMDHTKMPKE
ncbi:VOC family protein [Flavobacterium sedimenticola]|uniref:Extradiol dioxygenase n=1 Tax=Flavobacterium sedimenticola TaxID=3043286 RepID=A0ABT6XQN8_9FLAO|nr:VOC family protein [Flavobacterium sedimenticola]MDI9257343.1 extradiol dioxygenase [Flavobacterium sedimenticola]